jgi:hypothetical protein
MRRLLYRSLLLLAAFGSPVLAQETAAKGKPVSAEREVELLQFVRTHHAELATLLEQLKPARPAEYRAALGDLDRDVRRLEQTRKRSPKHHEAELNVWVARSQVRLLSARLSMSDDPALRDELRAQLRRLRELELVALDRQIASLQQSIERQQKKLEKLQEQSGRLREQEEEKWLAEQTALLERQRRSTAQATGKQKPKSKPSGAPNSP